MISYLGEDNCPVTNLFLDWNPIHTEEFKAGDSAAGTNALYEMQPPTEEDQPEEVSLFAKLISEGKKL